MGTEEEIHKYLVEWAYQQNHPEEFLTETTDNESTAESRKYWIKLIYARPAFDRLQNIHLYLHWYFGGILQRDGWVGNNKHGGLYHQSKFLDGESFFPCSSKLSGYFSYPCSLCGIEHP